MQISHTVYRERNNEIKLQLLSDDSPLDSPEIIERVVISVFTADAVIEKDSDDDNNVDYDGGILTMQLGRIEDIVELSDGVYEVEVIGFKDNDENGTVFGSFLIYLRDAGGEVPNES